MTTTAKTTIRLKVTQEHIYHGRVGNSRECPLALAFKDAGCATPCVGLRFIGFKHKNKEGIVIEMPEQLSHFRQRFDFCPSETQPFESDRAQSNTERPPFLLTRPCRKDTR